MLELIIRVESAGASILGLATQEIQIEAAADRSEGDRLVAEKPFLAVC